MVYRKTEKYFKTCRLLTPSIALSMALAAMTLHGCQEVVFEEQGDIIGLDDLDDLDELDRDPSSKEYNEGVYLTAAGSVQALGEGKGDVYELDEDGTFKKIHGITNTTIFHHDYFYVLSIYDQPNYQGGECHLRLNNSAPVPYTWQLDLVYNDYCGRNWDNDVKSYRRAGSTNICLYENGLNDQNPTCYAPSSHPVKTDNNFNDFGLSGIKLTVNDKNDAKFLIYEGNNNNRVHEGNNSDRIMVYGSSRNLTSSSYDAYEKNLSSIEINDYDLDRANYNTDDSKLGLTLDSSDNEQAAEAADIASLAGYFNDLPSGISTVILGEYAGKIRRCKPTNTCWTNINCTGQHVVSTFQQCSEWEEDWSAPFAASSYCTPLGYCVRADNNQFVLQ